MVRFFWRELLWKSNRSPQLTVHAKVSMYVQGWRHVFIWKVLWPILATTLTQMSFPKAAERMQKCQSRRAWRARGWKAYSEVQGTPPRVHTHIRLLETYPLVRSSGSPHEAARFLTIRCLKKGKKMPLVSSLLQENDLLPQTDGASAFVCVTKIFSPKKRC